MRSWGTYAYFRTRPALSVVVAVVFMGLAVLIAGGWLPRAEAGAVSRGESIAMAVVCSLLAGFFLRCARK